MHLFKKFRKDKRGSFGMMAATTSLMAVMALGTAVDITRAMNTQTKLQLMADNIGLTAAIYVKENGQQPANRSQGFVEGALYSVAEAGGTARLPGVTGGFKVHYNQEHSRAEVTFEGELETSFMAAFNKAQMDIDVQAKVQYFETAIAATSVVLIIDNSGSMSRSDGSGRTRIEGARSVMKTFNQDLNDNLSAAVSANGEKYLRMGLIAYNTDVISSREVNLKWGTFSTSQINAMQAGGGTNSSPPLSKASSWMNSEDTIHKNESGTTDPTKYVIFMTDGVNNNQSDDNTSISTCKAMTSKGIQVYAIGFSLSSGSRALSFLERCASTPDHFIDAKNTAALNIAFEQIGKSIAQDSIRISG